MSNNKRVLVIDDQKDSRVFVKTVLSETGDFDTAEAENGDDALRLLNEYIPDLIILDVVMPGMNGMTLFHQLKQKEETRNIPVIMLTGIADDIGIKFTAEGIEENLGAAPAAFIEKPADPAELQREIVKALEL